MMHKQTLMIAQHTHTQCLSVQGHSHSSWQGGSCTWPCQWPRMTAVVGIRIPSGGTGLLRMQGMHSCQLSIASNARATSVHKRPWCIYLICLASAAGLRSLAQCRRSKFGGSARSGHGSCSCAGFVLLTHETRTQERMLTNHRTDFGTTDVQQWSTCFAMRQKTR